MSKKDEALRDLGDGELLELARSVSKSPISDGTSTSVLKKIIKESLSIEEIKEKLKLKPKRPEPNVATYVGTSESIQRGLRLGSIGQVFLLVSSVLGLLPSYLSYLYTLGFDIYIFSYSVGIVCSIIFFVFVFLFWVSTRKVTGNYGDRHSWKFGFFCGIVASVALLVLDILSLYSALTGYYMLAFLIVILPLVYDAFLASTLILVGVFFVLHRKNFANSEVWLVTGVFYVYAGVLSLPTAYFSSLLPSSLAPAIIGTLCFLDSTAHGQSEIVTLTRKDLRLGASGMAVLAISAAIFLPGYYIYSWSLGPSPFDYYQVMAPWGFIGSGFLLLSSILLGVSMLKVRSKLGGGKLGLAGALLEVLTSVVGLLYYGLTMSGAILVISVFGFQSTLNVVGFVLSTAYFWLMGAAIVLFGSFFLVHRENGSNSELWMFSAMAFMLIGLVELGQSAYLYVPTALVLAGVVGVACFLGKEERR